MLTTRGWWFLVAVLALLGFGLVGHFALIILVGLTLLLWFAWEALRFAVHLHFTLPNLRVARAVEDDRGPVANLWAGQTFKVRVELDAAEGARLPYLVAVDRVPFGVDHLSGSNVAEGLLQAGQPLQMHYRIRCGPVGQARFEGLRVQMADLQGFFYHATLVPAVQAFRILPVLVDSGARRAGVKRNNQLLPPGIHRLRRPGSGSELLDLRDYMPGDPPKTIAWKVSARRDRLITKEYETEVPVRCTLFVDTSNSVRVPSLPPPRRVEAGPIRRAGRERKALDRLIDLAASVIQANTASRDPTGLCLFDEHAATVIRPDRSGTQLRPMLNLLADAATLSPSMARVDPEPLTPLAYAFAEEVYPNLLRPSLNAMPIWTAWFGGFPARSRRRLGWFQYLRRHKGRAFFLASFLASIFWLFALAPQMRGADIVTQASLALFPLLAGLLVYLLLVLTSGSLRRQAAWRKRLAALLSVRHDLYPGGLGTLLEDDDQYALHLQQFLAEHQVPYELPLYDARGQYLFAAPAKVPVLADALLRAVGKGRDNELFVLLVDLLELDDRLDPLINAVRVALGRHHQVIVVCPWPPGLPLPSSRAPWESWNTGGDARKAPPPPAPVASALSAEVADDLELMTTRLFHDAYQRVRRTFARMAVPMVCAASDEPMSLVRERLERLRTQKRKR